MRAFVLCALLAAAAAAGPLTISSGAADGVTFRVSQTGPLPGASTITPANLLAGQVDVRTGGTLTTISGTGTTFDAPYSGCYWFYADTANADASFTKLSGPTCTTNSEWKADGTSNHAPVAVTAGSFSGTGDPNVYAFSMSFSVDIGYAGVAFEFLNMNVADPANANTRCGVSFDNLTPPDGSNSILNYHPGQGQTKFRMERMAAVNSGASKDANGAWDFSSRTYTGSVTTAPVNYSIADFNNALINCGWKRNETNPIQTVFHTQVRITTVQQGRAIRGVLYKSVKESIVEIGIAVNTGVNATSPQLAVNAPEILFTQITKQVFDPTTRKAYLVLFTSSQGPYQLQVNTSLPASCNGGGCQNWVATPAAGFSVFRPLNGAGDTVLQLTDPRALAAVADTNEPTLRAQCYNQNGNVPNYQTETPTAFTQCNQYWFIQLNADDRCGTLEDVTPRTLNGDWKVTFNIRCHSSYKGSCVILGDTPSAVPVTFSTTSDDYCPRVVDTVSSSATLSVFEDTQMTKQQSQFVFGTTSYFKANVKSSIIIENIYTEEVSIIRGGAVDNSGAGALGSPASGFVAPTGSGERQILYTNGFGAGTVTATYFAGVETVGASSCSGRSGLNTKISTLDTNAGAQLPAPDGYTTIPCYAATSNQAAVQNWRISQYGGGSTLLTADNFFQFYWNSATSNATGDFAEITQVFWSGRIRYKDQANKVHQLSSYIKPNLAAVAASTATVTSTMSAPQSSPASSQVISTTTIAVAAAAVAAIAVMAVAAAVILRSRNVKMESETNLESITLGAVTTSSSTARL